jgi:hypothetical protein
MTGLVDIASSELPDRDTGVVDDRHDEMAQQ